MEGGWIGRMEGGRIFSPMSTYKLDSGNVIGGIFFFFFSVFFSFFLFFYVIKWYFVNIGGKIFFIYAYEYLIISEI